MNTSTLEKLAIGASIVSIVGWGIFWIVQVISVIEFLEMAYG